MKNKWGIVGIGRLGSAIASNTDENIGAYHPNAKKVKEFCGKYKNIHPLELAELRELDYMVLSLPADAIADFISDIESKMDISSTTLINMSTSKKTEELRDKFPRYNWLGVKFMGHAETYREDGNGLFVIEEDKSEGLDIEEISRFYGQLGKVVFDREDVVEDINKLGTYYGIKVAKELEDEMTKNGYPGTYKTQVMRSIIPGVIRAYMEGDLGHFGKSVLKILKR